MYVSPSDLSCVANNLLTLFLLPGWCDCQRYRSSEQRGVLRPRWRRVVRLPPRLQRQRSCPRHRETVPLLSLSLFMFFA